MKQVCRSASSEEKGNSQAKQYSKKSSKVGNNSCKKTKKRQKKIVKTVEDVNSSNDSDDEKLLSVKTVNSVKDEIYFCIEGHSVPFEIDSGAAVSTLTKDWANKLQLPIHDCSKKLKAYDNSKIDVFGKVDVNLTYNSHCVQHKLYVVGNNNSNLCGKRVNAQSRNLFVWYF